MEYLVLVSALLSFVACFYYIRSMFAGIAKPNRVSWLLWSIAPLVATFASFSAGVRWAILPVFMSGFSPLLIFIFSFVAKKGYWETTLLDYICGGFSVIALILWGITKEPNLAIGFAILSDGLAALPTIRKTWTNPETENAFPFLAGIFGSVTSFLAIKTWVFSAYSFPAYLILANIAILAGVLRKKLRR